MSEWRIATPEDVEADAARLRVEYARLFAAAHELARVLLSVEWSGTQWDSSGGASCCPCCRAVKDPFIVGAPGHHRENCALDAALRGAGAR